MNTYLKKSADQKTSHLWCNNKKACKVLRFYRQRFDWLFMSSSGHDL